MASLHEAMATAIAAHQANQIPPGEERHYRERILRMPDDYATFEPFPGAPAVGPLRAERTGTVTFGSLNNLAKCLAAATGAAAPATAAPRIAPATGLATAPATTVCVSAYWRMRRAGERSRCAARADAWDRP